MLDSGFWKRFADPGRGIGVKLRRKFRGNAFQHQDTKDTKSTKKTSLGRKEENLLRGLGVLGALVVKNVLPTSPLSPGRRRGPGTEDSCVAPQEDPGLRLSTPRHKGTKRRFLTTKT